MDTYENGNDDDGAASYETDEAVSMREDSHTVLPFGRSKTFDPPDIRSVTSRKSTKSRKSSRSSIVAKSSVRTGAASQRNRDDPENPTESLLKMTSPTAKRLHQASRRFTADAGCSSVFATAEEPPPVTNEKKEDLAFSLLVEEGKAIGDYICADPKTVLQE